MANRQPPRNLMFVVEMPGYLSSGTMGKGRNHLLCVAKWRRCWPCCAGVRPVAAGLGGWRRRVLRWQRDVCVCRPWCVWPSGTAACAAVLSPAPGLLAVCGTKAAAGKSGRRLPPALLDLTPAKAAVTLTPMTKAPYLTLLEESIMADPSKPQEGTADVPPELSAEFIITALLTTLRQTVAIHGHRPL
jgi:hypothetical protein